MGKCHYCDKDDWMNRDCKFCGETFCSEHRLPENHECWEAKMYREFSNEMRRYGDGNISGANADVVHDEFRDWLEEKREKLKKKK